MTKSKYEINIASVPDREQVVAEIWIGDVLFAELRREGTDVLVEMYPRPSGEPWVVESEWLSGIMLEAKSKLLGQ